MATLVNPSALFSGGGTVGGNITVEGDLEVQGTTNIGSAIASAIDLGDNQPARFGDDDDVELSFDGTNLILERSDGTDIQTIDPTDGDITFGVLGGDPSFGDHTHDEGGLNSIPNAGLVNSSITVSSGDGLKSGGSVSLGGSVTIDIEPADFSGEFLSDDGSDNLEVDISTGLEGDGTGSIRVNPGGIVGNGLTEDTTTTLGIATDGVQLDEIDESISPTWLSAHTFNSGLDAQGDITDGVSVIYNSTGGYIEQTILENDSVTVSSGDGLKNGGSVSLGNSLTINVEPADFAGSFLSDDGSDNLTVNISNGLENDGGGSIRINPEGIAGNGLTEVSTTTLGIDTNGVQTDEIDLTIAPTWTGQHTFNAQMTMGADIDLQSTQKVINVPEPTNSDDIARKGYVDGVAQGLNLKDSVRAATDGTNIDLTSATDPNPVDGVTLNNGDRVLLKDQTDGTENGIYIANTATDPTTWTRSLDFDDDADVTSGSFTFAEEGTNNSNTSWIVTTPDPITVGSTSISWAQFSAAGEIEAGDGLTKTAQTLDIEPADFAGPFLSDDGTNDLQVNTGNGIEGDGSDNIRVDEDFDFTFTSTITFSSGLTSGGSINLSNNDNIQSGGVDAIQFDSNQNVDVANGTLTVGFNSRDDIQVVDSMNIIGGDQNTTFQQRYAATVLSDRTVTGNSQRIEFDDNSGANEGGLPYIRASGGEMQAFGPNMAGGFLVTATGSYLDLTTPSRSIRLGDVAQNPSTNGEILNNGGDVIVQTGGSDLNLSNVGTGGAFADDDSDNIAEFDTANFNGAELQDDIELYFGTDGNDISVRWSSADGDMRWRDEGNNADRMALDRTTGDLSIEGTFTEGATL